MHIYSRDKVATLAPPSMSTLPVCWCTHGGMGADSGPTTHPELHDKHVLVYCRPRLAASGIFARVVATLNGI